MVDQIIETVCPIIFDDAFPIFDEAYRLPLEKKILKHFYTREIAYETYGLWRLKLNTKMEEIMPLYNQYYESSLLEFNPFYDIDLNRTHTNQSEGSTVSESKANRNEVNNGTSDLSDERKNNRVGQGTTKSKDKYSDTPQGALQNIENESYLTNARIIEGNNNDVSSDDSKGKQQRIDNNISNSTGTSDYKDTIKNTNLYIEKVAGKAGGSSYSTRLKEFRETFLNIDMMIIKELEGLFYMLW